MRLTGKDLAATLFTGAVVGVYVAFLQGADLPFLGSVRGTAGVVLALGWVGGCALSGVGDAYTRKQTSPLLVAVLTAIGAVALVAAVMALVTASEAALTVLVVSTVLLWFGATVRHMVARPTQLAATSTQDATGHRLTSV